MKRLILSLLLLFSPHAQAWRASARPAGLALARLETDAAPQPLGIDDRAIKKDLQNFKQFIESRPVETGAWRGDVPRD